MTDRRNRSIVYGMIACLPAIAAFLSGLAAHTAPSRPVPVGSAPPSVPPGGVSSPVIAPGGQPPPNEADDPNALAPPPPVGPRVPPKAIEGTSKVKLPVVRAASAILMDADTGQVIYEKDADARRPMASTTKIMTAMLFAESVPDNTVITASKNACRIHNCSLHLKLGEQITAHDLLRAILLRSANDACVAAAETVAGTEEAFVSRMNARAAALGATNTHFANPHGLTRPDHFTTARDLANIAREVVKQKRVLDVVKLLDCTINRSIRKNDVNLHNYSHFVGRYAGAEGLKSGWTTPSGHCYVGVASRGKWRLISVVLNTPEYGVDSTHLMDFGFNKYERVDLVPQGTPEGLAPITDGVSPTVTSHTASALKVVIPKGEHDQVTSRAVFTNVSAPVKTGGQVGEMQAVLCGAPVFSVPLVADSGVNAVPKALTASTHTGRVAASAFFVLSAGVVSLRYGNRKKHRYRYAASSKGSRRRRSRFSANMRDDYRSR